VHSKGNYNSCSIFMNSGLTKPPLMHYQSFYTRLSRDSKKVQIVQFVCMSFKQNISYVCFPSVAMIFIWNALTPCFYLIPLTHCVDKVCCNVSQTSHMQVNIVALYYTILMVERITLNPSGNQNYSHFYRLQITNTVEILTMREPQSNLKCTPSVFNYRCTIIAILRLNKSPKFDYT